MAHRIDLNSDLGEAFGAWSMGDDDALLDVVTSANIACGFHAGDPRVMARCVARAADRGVAIGAHVSYPDLVGFGRRDMAASPEEVRTDVLYQLGALDGIARAAGTSVRYVKAHGALYHAMATDDRIAEAVCGAVWDFGGADMAVLTLAGSASVAAGERLGIRVATEAFADRAYRPDGELVARGLPGAVVHDPAEVVERSLDIACRNRVRAADGSDVAVEAVSLCVHGDTPAAASLARTVREALQAASVVVAPFA